MTQSLSMSAGHLALYLVVMALVTYLIRMLPFTLFRREIKSTRSEEHTSELQSR